MMKHLQISWANFFNEVASNGLYIPKDTRYVCLAFGKIGGSVIMVIGHPQQVQDYINERDHAILVYEQEEVHCKGFDYAFELSNHMIEYQFMHDSTSLGVVNLLTGNTGMVETPRAGASAV